MEIEINIKELYYKNTADDVHCCRIFKSFNAMIHVVGTSTRASEKNRWNFKVESFHNFSIEPCHLHMDDRPKFLRAKYKAEQRYNVVQWKTPS